MQLRAIFLEMEPRMTNLALIIIIIRKKATLALKQYHWMIMNEGILKAFVDLNSRQVLGHITDLKGRFCLLKLFEKFGAVKNIIKM